MSEYARAQAGDAEALSALVRRHAPLVQSLCRRFSYSQDAFQLGCMGLVKAIRGYRAEAGYAFSTYAVPVILGEMRKAYSGALGWRAKGALRRARAYEESVLRQTGRHPDVGEIAARAGVPPEELMLLFEQDRGPAYDETGLMIPSLPDPGSDRFVTRLLIRDILDRMPKKESWLLRQRFVFFHTQKEIAKYLHTEQYRVSRLEKRARQHFMEAWQT